MAEAFWGGAGREGQAAAYTLLTGDSDHHGVPPYTSTAILLYYVL